MPDRPVVLDACIIITFGSEDRLDLLTEVGSRRIVVAERAREEVRRPPASTALAAALDDGRIEEEAIDLETPEEQEALARYDDRAAFRNRGDAEVLALAAARGYVVGSDERAIRRAARDDLGTDRTATTLDFLVWAVRQERLTRSQASAFLVSCDVGPHYLERLERAGKKLGDLV